MSFGAFLLERERSKELGSVPMGQAAGRAYGKELSSLRSRWERLAAFLASYRDVAAAFVEAPEEFRAAAIARLGAEPTPAKASELERVVSPLLEHWKEVQPEPAIEDIEGLHAELQSAEGFAHDFGYENPPKDDPPSLEEMSASVAAAEEVHQAATELESAVRQAGRETVRLWDEIPIGVKIGGGLTLVAITAGALRAFWR